MTFKNAFFTVAIVITESYKLSHQMKDYEHYIIAGKC